MMRQLDFLETFEHADRTAEAVRRRWKAKHDLIDQITADPKVIRLLHGISDLPFASDGENYLVTATISEIGRAIGRSSSNTVSDHLKLAYASGFLSLLDPNTQHEARTYLIHWRSILEQRPTTQDATSTGSDSSQRDATSTAVNGNGGHELRGSNSQIEPLNFQTEGLNSPSHSPKTLENVFDSSVKEKRLKECPGLSPSRRNPLPQAAGFWAKWEAAVLTRDLFNDFHVHELHELAVSLGIVAAGDELGRRHIFEQAELNERLHRNKELKTRKGLFVSNVANRRWWCSCQDEDAARRRLKAAERFVRSQDPRAEIERQRRLAIERFGSEVISAERPEPAHSPGG